MSRRKCGVYRQRRMPLAKLSKLAGLRTHLPCLPAKGDLGRGRDLLADQIIENNSREEFAEAPRAGQGDGQAQGVEEMHFPTNWPPSWASAGPAVTKGGGPALAARSHPGHGR